VEENDGRKLVLMGVTMVRLEKGGGAKADAMNLLVVVDRRIEKTKAENERVEGVMMKAKWNVLVSRD